MLPRTMSRLYGSGKKESVGYFEGNPNQSDTVASAMRPRKTMPTHATRGALVPSMNDGLGVSTTLSGLRRPTLQMRNSAKQTDRNANIRPIHSHLSVEKVKVMPWPAGI